MGNDGGSIPTRRELVKEAARDRTTTEVKETQQEQQEYLWTTCPLSHRPLTQPVVSDLSGKLYNKDAILEFLLPSDDDASALQKSDSEKVLQGRVRSLRDVVEVIFEVDEENDNAKHDAVESKRKRWVCPVTQKILGPAVKAVYLVPCGHAFSELGIKETFNGSCIQCNKSCTAENIIPILPTAEKDISHLETRLQSLKEQGLTHSLKKAPGAGKKRKKNIDEATTAEVPKLVLAEGKDAKQATVSKIQAPNGAAAPSARIKNAATASLTARVLQEEREKHKRRKLGSGNDNLSTLFSSQDTSQPNKTGDFMTRGYSIPANARR